MQQPGRNDPCACGSGRKFKHCCLDKADADDQARVNVRRAEGRIVQTVFGYALQRFGKPFFEEAWLEFYLDETPEAEAFDEVPEFEPMFVPWFTTLFVRDPHGDTVEPHWPDEPLALHWMKTENPELTPLEHEWIVAACRSPMSPTAVEAVEPGRSVDLRDLLTGRQFHVLEQSASRTLERGSVLFTRIVTAGGVSVMLGAAPISFPVEWQIEMLQWRDRTFRRRKVTRRLLEEYDIEIRDFYLALADRARNPRPPRLQNTDGDDLELTTLTYRLTMTVAEACAKLEPLATLGDERHVEDVTTDAAGAMTGAELQWMKAGNKKHANWDNTILGRLVLAPGQLTAEVNSARRADRLMKEIARRLGTHASLRSRTIVSADEMFAAARRRSGSPAERQSAAAPGEPRPPEIDALEDDLFRQHTRAWIDTPVPALGNRTPRQASRSARGRERLEALVLGFERMARSAREARRQALVGLRQELGLPPRG